MFTIDDDPSVLQVPSTARGKYICTCGHAEARHIVMPGRGQMCDALKGNCPCRDMDLVIEVSDARVFMRSAEADVHPLVAGILKLKERGGTYTWLGERDACEFTPPGMGQCSHPMKTAVYVDDGRSTQLRCKEHAT